MAYQQMTEQDWRALQEAPLCTEFPPWEPALHEVEYLTPRVRLSPDLPLWQRRSLLAMRAQIDRAGCPNPDPIIEDVARSMLGKWRR